MAEILKTKAKIIANQKFVHFKKISLLSQKMAIAQTSTLSPPPLKQRLAVLCDKGGNGRYPMRLTCKSVKVYSTGHLQYNVDFMKQTRMKWYNFVQIFSNIYKFANGN